MNKITIIKECIKAYNRENTIKANVVYLNPHDYYNLELGLDNNPIKINHEGVWIDDALIKRDKKQKVGNVTVGYKPELIFN